MNTREVTFVLPSALALQAQAVGLLEPEAIVSLLRAEIRRRAEQFSNDIDRLSQLDLPPLTEEEVAAEIRAVREERRAERASSA